MQTLAKAMWRSTQWQIITLSKNVVAVPPALKISKLKTNNATTHKNKCTRTVGPRPRPAQGISRKQVKFTRFSRVLWRVSRKFHASFTRLVSGIFWFRAFCQNTHRNFEQFRINPVLICQVVQVWAQIHKTTSSHVQQYCSIVLFFSLCFCCFVGRSPFTLPFRDTKVTWPKWRFLFDRLFKQTKTQKNKNKLHNLFVFLFVRVCLLLWSQSMQHKWNKTEH